jgi:hypothetical protein
MPPLPRHGNGVPEHLETPASEKAFYCLGPDGRKSVSLHNKKGAKNGIVSTAAVPRFVIEQAELV